MALGEADDAHLVARMAEQESANVDEIADQIRNYTTMGWFSDAATYFASLSEDLRKVPVINFEIARLCCYQGIRNTAIAVLDYAGFDLTNVDAIMDAPPEVLCMVILRAYICVLTDRKSRTGLKVVELFRKRRAGLPVGETAYSWAEVLLHKPCIVDAKL